MRCVLQLVTTRDVTFAPLKPVLQQEITRAEAGGESAVAQDEVVNSTSLGDGEGKEKHISVESACAKTDFGPFMTCSPRTIWTNWTIHHERSHGQEESWPMHPPTQTQLLAVLMAVDSTLTMSPAARQPASIPTNTYLLAHQALDRS